MARPTRFKVKKKGKWRPMDDVDMEDVPVVPEMPTLDLASLPDRAELDDPDMTLEQIYAEHPSVRAYLTCAWVRDANPPRREIRIRAGIPREFRAVAQDILRKYGKKEAGDVP